MRFLQTYTAAEAELTAICQQAASMISAAIGLIRRAPAAHPAVGDAMQKTTKLPIELYEATDSLIQNLLASEAFLTYQQSQVELDAEPRGA